MRVAGSRPDAVSPMSASAGRRFRDAGFEMCSGSEAVSYSRLINFVYHSTLGLRVIQKKSRRSPGESDFGFRVSGFGIQTRRGFADVRVGRAGVEVEVRARDRVRRSCDSVWFLLKIKFGLI